MIPDLLARLGRAGPQALAGGIFIGLLWPGLASAAHPLLMPSIVVLLTLSLTRLDWRRFGAWLARPLTAALATGWQLLASPLIAWAAASALALPAPVTIGLVLTAASAPIISAPAFAYLLALDAALAAALVVASTVLLPLTLVPLAALLLGLELNLGAGDFLTRVLVFIVSPFALAGLLRALPSARWLDRHAGELDGTTVLVLMVFAVSIMEGATARLMTEPWLFLAFLAAALALNLVSQVVGALVFWPAGARTALSIGFCAGNRNMGLLLALAGPAAGHDFQLYVAVAQLPVFVLPLFALRVYARILAGRER